MGPEGCLATFDETWKPQVGQAIKRRHDPEAPKHYVTAVRGSGAYRSLTIDKPPTRWWPTDLFEPFEPIKVVALDPDGPTSDMLPRPEAVPATPTPSGTP